MTGVVARRLVAVLALVSVACTGDRPEEARTPEGPDATVRADTLSSACEHFATLWVEFAQIDSSRLHGMGDSTPDPHAVRAQVAADAAFEAAEQGSGEVQRLGAKASDEFEGSADGDVWATVAEVFALCDQAPPVVGCRELTPCRSNNLDRATAAVPRVWLFPPNGSGEQAGLGGTLAYDAAVNCLFMKESGEAIVWPEGTVGTADGPGVVLPDGQVARVGDSIFGGGGHHHGAVASNYGIAPECVTDTLTVFQFDEIEVNAHAPAAQP